MESCFGLKSESSLLLRAVVIVIELLQGELRRVTLDLVQVLLDLLRVLQHFLLPVATRFSLLAPYLVRRHNFFVFVCVD